MSLVSLCLVCRAEIPPGSSRCADHALVLLAATPGYGRYRAARPGVLAASARCAFCGRGPRAGDPFEVNHRRERVAGGTHDAANLEAAHRSCNRARRATAAPGLRVLDE